MYMLYNYDSSVIFYFFLVSPFLEVYLRFNSLSSSGLNNYGSPWQIKDSLENKGEDAPSINQKLAMVQKVTLYFI